MINGLETTSNAITSALEAAMRLPNTPLIEVETYAWTQLPHMDRVSTHTEMTEGIVQEIRYAQACAIASQSTDEHSQA